MAHRWRAILLDLWPVAFLLVIGLGGTGPAAANQGQTAPWPAYVLVVLAALAVSLWRRRPTWTFTAVGAIVVAYLAAGYAYGPILLALVVAIYGLAVRSPVRRTLSSLAALLAASVVAVAVGIVAGERDWPEFVTMSAWLVVPAAVGVVVKVRRDAAAEVRAEQARRAASEERLHLAQEMHDTVGHGLAVIAMQSGVALRVFDRDPARTREALEAIRATSQEALEGLRAEVTALRTQPRWRDAPRRPNTGLADLSGLAERMRRSGLPVTIDLPDPDGGAGDATGVDDVPAEVDHAAYRIVQESLTNVLRHGGPAATARVRIWRDAGMLHVEVVDTGGGATGDPPREGHGIEGMRERAAALGGTLDAGPHPAGGFAVRARLSCAADAPARESVPAKGAPA